MNRTELVAAMAEKAGVSKKDADNILKAFIDTPLKRMTRFSLWDSAHLSLVKERLVKAKIRERARKSR